MKTKNAIKSYGKMFLKAIFFSVIITLIWRCFFWVNFTKFPENNEVMSAVVAGFLVFSALLPSFTVSRLSQQYDELKSAVVDEDFKLFKKIYKRTVHPLTYLAIIVISILAILSLMMMPYQRAIVGIFAVAGLSFVHCFFYLITKELDNPNCWDLKIPIKWMVDLGEEKREKAK